MLLSVAVMAQPPSTHAPLLVGNGPPQYPADPRMFISSQEIQQRIAQADAAVASGKMYSGEPLVLQGPYRATMEWRNTAQKSINVHQTDAEIFVILQGSGAMTLGGTLVDPRPAHTFAWEGPTLTSEKVKDAKVYKVTQGDIIMIPPNTPHTVSAVDGKLVLWSMHLPMPNLPSGPLPGITPGVAPTTTER